MGAVDRAGYDRALALDRLSPQAAVIGLLLLWGKPLHALAITALLAIQGAAMRVLVRDPEGKTPWYQGMGILFYISGMMVAAFAIRGL